MANSALWRIALVRTRCLKRYIARETFRSWSNWSPPRTSDHRLQIVLIQQRSDVQSTAELAVCQTIYDRGNSEPGSSYVIHQGKRGPSLTARRDPVID
jgi:hypothetical protein